MPDYPDGPAMFLLLPLQITVVIAACLAAGWLARRSGQPRVVGEMAAGLLLGPSVLGAALPAVSGWLFPTQGMAALGWVSQAAIALFMFSLGLEQQASVMRRQKWTVIAVSLCGIVLPFALGCALALWLYPQYAQGQVPQLAFVLFTGTALSMTALPVLARILREKNLLATEAGGIAMAAAVFSDICMWVLLAVVLIFCKPGAGQLPSVVLGLAWVGFMLWLVRPALAKLVQWQPSLQVYLITSLMVLISFAWLADHLGLHMLLGAFLAGVVMPRHPVLVPRVLRLVARPMVWALHLFFAFTGLRTHLQLTGMTDVLLVAAVIGVACAGKAGGAFIGARMTGCTAATSALVAVLMNARGLMELVILNIGMDLGLLTAPVFAAMVLMAFVTTLMTGPLVNLLQVCRQRKLQDGLQY
ncbi:cation:proton antiporter domain-containing protein [Silvimonas iriomotensis]|uniref:Cation/H+ exchanger transmembrane domain-containing protein n=1 Tax=Silvimonas iriomotensis TaxID=449662 RepID=A0ABQ2PAB3_9NEIS|nr:cation:proton antiporter [Silvimonas iriomotensis]GGP21764.1 hypothetical protein GCM10010970_22100 [Silvimonas iriomotensis]